MKKKISVFLAVVLLMSMAVTAFAVDPTEQVNPVDPKFTFDLTAVGTYQDPHDIEVETNDIVTVLYSLSADTGDGCDAFTQDEIYYDTSFFEFVEDSVKLEEGVEGIDIGHHQRNDKKWYVYFNNGSPKYFDNDMEYAPIGTFKLKVIATTGSSTIQSTNFGAKTMKNEPYKQENFDLTVTIAGSTPPAPPAPHTHSWTYEASGNKIIATCGNSDCTVTGSKVELTLTANGGTYSGSPFAASTDDASVKFAETTGATVGQISYYLSSGSSVPGAPTNAGSYVAKVTAGEKTAVQAFTISRANQTVSAADKNFTTTSTGASVSGTTTGDGAISYAVQSGDSVSVNASTGALTINKTGTTTIRVTAAETTNYNSAYKDITVTVGNTEIAKPTADNTTFTYNKSSQTYSPVGFDSSTMEISNNVKTNAGSYTVSVTPKTGYTWNGGSTEAVNFTFKINKADQTVSASDKNFTITSTGASVSGTTTGDGAITYAVKSGDAVYVNASTGALLINKNGTSTIRVTAAETTNYNSAYKDITVTVGNAQIAKPTKSLTTYTYNKSAQTYVPVGFDSSTMSITGNVQTNAGSYTVSVTPKAGYCWNGGSTEAVDFTFEIKKADHVINASDVNVTYGDSGKSVGATCSTGTVSYSKTNGDSVSVNASTGALTISKVGESTVRVTVPGSQNYNETTKDITVTVAPKKITPPTASSTTYTYNKSAQTYKPTGYLATTMSIENNVQTDAGSYTVKVTPKANYAWSDGSTTAKEYTFKINKANQPITATDKNFTYGDSGKSVGASVDTGNALTYSVTSGSAVSVDASTGALTINSAGDATVKITAAGSTNYNETTKSITVSIAKKAISKPTKVAKTYYYNSSAQTLQLNGFLSGTMDIVNNVQTNAGTYNVTVTPKSNYKWSDDGDCTFEFVINTVDYTGATTTATGNLDSENGSSVEITLPDVPTGAAYGTPVKNATGDKYTLSAINGKKITVTSTGIAKGTGNMTFTVPVTPDGNHNGYNITVTVVPQFHDHVGVSQGSLAAEEFKPGYKEYFRCDCGKFFEDEDCTTVISDLAAWKAEGGRGYIAPTHKHAGVHQDGVAATTKAAGYKEYYKCTCGDYFEDANCTVAIEDLATWKAEGGKGYLPKLKDEGSPDTGDASNMAPWFAMMGISALAVFSCIVLGKKRKSEN